MGYMIGLLIGVWVFDGVANGIFDRSVQWGVE